MAPEKRDENLEKRFYYTNYVAPEKRDEDLEKRFYDTHYVAPEKRDEDLESVSIHQLCGSRKA